MQFDIRNESSADIEAIEALTIAAFLAAPHAGHNEQTIIRSMRDSGELSVSLVAQLQDELLGHVAVSEVVISDGTKGWYGLGPISVSPAYQGQGIGSQLMRAAIKQLKNINASGCVLLGDPAYYHRFGFKPEADLILADVPPEYFQVLSFRTILPKGLVSYCTAFKL